MYTALRATSNTIASFLSRVFEHDPGLRTMFAPLGTRVVSLSSPEVMTQNSEEGLSVWLYRVMRDEETLNLPPERVGPDRMRHRPLPVRLHYLMTPLSSTTGANSAGPETEQVILGKVLQTFNDHPALRGVNLKDELSGTAVELFVRLEPLSLEEITRVWDAFEGSYRLSISYEVSVVWISSGEQPEPFSPVEVIVTDMSVIV
jgi:hypothetical protein